VGRAFLRTAPASAVEVFLERVEEDLLPREALDDAEKILRAVQIESPRLRESSDLARRTAELVEQVLRKREERLERLVHEERPAKAARPRWSTETAQPLPSRPPRLRTKREPAPA
jgi:hypothetical protein